MNNKSRDPRIDNGSETIALIGNYVPRQCGIATFTHDLRNALAAASKERDFWTVAMNDIPEGYSYPKQVRFEVHQNHFSEYGLAANFLNMNRVELVCLQHEFGIFGGNDGSHILSLLRDLRMPLVTTLHTVLENPSDGQRQVMSDLGKIADRFVVMSRLASEMLASAYDIAEERIAFIPHGIPDVPFIDPSFYKDQFGVEGRKVILTFGLLGPGKGLEYVIDALPAIAQRYPEVVYLIVGATHPNVKKESGEAYRISLQQRARSLGVQDNILFHNRFVSLEKLCEFLISSDLYITPYLNRDQITSGTLAYAMGTGNAVISTPYRYAEEMLADGRGKLVPFADSEAIAAQVLDLFDNPVEMNSIRKQAYNYTRPMIWSQVARSYLDLFAELKLDRTNKKYTAYPVRNVREISDDLPMINLNQMRLLTDDTGMLQHSRFMIPKRVHGYATDDNARALLVAMTAQEVMADTDELNNFANLYLSFLDFAFDYRTRKFKNFLSYSRRWSRTENLEDCYGRSIRSLGMTVALSKKESQCAMAMDLYERALPVCQDLVSPRAISLALLGAVAYGSRFKGDRTNRQLIESLVSKLVNRFADNATEAWPWLEEKVTYDNARIPQAIIAAGSALENPEFISCGTKSLEWLLEIQEDPAGHFVPIGNKGWYQRDGQKARHDQQPIEACAMLEACTEAYIVTGDDHWQKPIIRCFDWFLGRNDIRMPLYDYSTGGCRDGLTSSGVNQNQGAESTLSWLMALITMHRCRALWGAKLRESRAFQHTNN